MKEKEIKNSTGNGEIKGQTEISSEEKINEFLARKGHLRVRQGIFTVCFILFCLIDQFLGSAPGTTHDFFIKCIGLVIAVIILNHDSEIEERSILNYFPYAVWALLFLFGVRRYALQTFGPDISDSFGWLTGYGDNPLAGSLELAEWIVLVCNIGIYGIIIIRTIMEYATLRRLPRMNWPLFCIWAIMLAGMLLSQNDSMWPLCFLILFGLYYLTEYSRDELICLMNGMMNGIIAAFFISFALSSLYRTFDTAGYCGMYTEYSKNALFYLFVHAALLGKWFQYHKTGASWVWKALAAAGSCFVAGYGFITTVRPAIYLMLLNTLITILFIFLFEKNHRVPKALGRAAAVISLIALLTPCAYWIARYMPYYYTTPLVYSTDDLNQKVLRREKKTENRYTTPEELREELIGQLFQFEDPDKQEWKESQSSLQHDILNAYFQELNFSGHPSDQSGFWITDWYYASHCKNIFLHMAYTFGLPAGFFFILFFVITAVFLLMRCTSPKNSDWWNYTGLLFLFTALAYGCFDRDWQVGQLPFTLLFLVPYLAIHRTISARKKNMPKRKEVFIHEGK